LTNAHAGARMPLAARGRSRARLFGRSSTKRRRNRRTRTALVRKFAFALLLILLCASLAYGLKLGDFWETISNGVMICLTCIGVA
jgi:hypothetical protein